MDDPEISTLLQDAVSDVEPSDRLTEIRSATAARPRRFGWYAAGGTAVAIAASVTAFSLFTSPDTDRRSDPTAPLTSAAGSETPEDELQAVYFVGDTSAGPRLFREFHRVPGAPSPEVGIQQMGGAPYDPDYRSYLPAPFIKSAALRDGIIDVTVAGSFVRQRPTGMTASDAELALQQVVYTVQAGAGTRAPVQFRLGRNPIDAVLGVPTSEPITNAPQLDVLSLVSISDPVESLQVTDSFIAHGVASSFEGNVPWELRDGDGTVVRSGAATAGMETYLVEWDTAPIDVSDLEAGKYTFVATTDDGAFIDTRTVVVL